MNAPSTLAIAWGVQAGDEGKTTRPARLVHELSNLGVDCGQRVSHGWNGIANATRALRGGAAPAQAPWIPSRPFADQPYGALTPLLGQPSDEALVWFDGYDDWSIAPDVSMPQRALAWRTYRTVAARKISLTANTPYMANVLGPACEVVPNGADEQLADAPIGGDDRLRVIVMGSLHRGRVDSRALGEVIGGLDDAQMVFAGTGTDAPAAIARELGRDVIFREFLPMAHVAGSVGRSSVALLPLRVSDYTLSQDPMKLYDYLALGLPVVMPRLLWPRHLPIERAVLYEEGDDVARLVRIAASLGTWSSAERRAFVDRHGWAARARAVRDLLGDVVAV